MGARRYDIISNGKQLSIDLASPSEVVLNGTIHQTHLSRQKNGLALLNIDGRTFTIFCKKLSETQYEIYYKHHVIAIEIVDFKSKIAEQLQKSRVAVSSLIIIKAPMPGLVTAIEVKAGDIVESGTGLIILEAMKMENEIRSTIRGKVKSIDVKERSIVDKGQPLIRIETLL